MWTYQKDEPGEGGHKILSFQDRYKTQRMWIQKIHKDLQGEGVEQGNI